MRLFLVRHGQAEPTERNPERPLTVKGREQIRKSAGFLKRVGARPAEIRHSGKRRAEESANIIAAELGGNVKLVSDLRLKPNAPILPVAAEIEAENTDVMLVGHLPFLSLLASYLLSGKEDYAFVDFTEGGVACLELESETWWARCLAQPDFL